MNKPQLYFMGPEHAQNHFPKNEVDILDISKKRLFEILELGEAYWGANTIGATLSWVVHSNFYQTVSPQLLISYHNKRGFHFFYISLEDTYSMAIESGAANVVPVTIDAQTNYYFPSISFHTLTTAKKVVDVFVDSRGQRCFTGLLWVETSDSFANPEAWKAFQNFC